MTGNSIKPPDGEGNGDRIGRLLLLILIGCPLLGAFAYGLYDLILKILELL